MLILALIRFVDILFTILTWAIIIRVLLSWIPGVPWHHPLVRLLRSITDPLLEPARRLIPPIGMLDISPIVVIIVLELVHEFLIRFLVNLAVNMPY
ncbi:MAG: YggT family protein [Chloroflexi bacterium]|nr:YggT family protein [Chloroflexota bacterium]